MNDINENINKISGLCYVTSDPHGGIELPVLDITHPLFIASINEVDLEDLSKKSPQLAQQMKMMPDAQRALFREKSLIVGERFNKDPNATYASGMSTYLLKLGPHLIGGGEERNLDRMLTMGISSVAARMRLRDLCRLQADALIPQLKDFPDKCLYFINIGGGTAIDSINTLILILNENNLLLKHRKIEINVLDIDSDSPFFGQRCIEALNAPGCRFHELDIELRHVQTDWSNTGHLYEVLSERKDCLMMTASEGGLFEYGSDEEIAANLRVLYENSPADTRITGSIMRDTRTIDPTIPAMAETSGASWRYLGKEGLERILENSSWTIEYIIEENPVYVLFTLKKKR